MNTFDLIVSCIICTLLSGAFFTFSINAMGFAFAFVALLIFVCAVFKWLEPNW